MKEQLNKEAGIERCRLLPVVSSRRTAVFLTKAVINTIIRSQKKFFF